MILIITNRQDLTADFVVRELNRRGIAFARLNTDEFPLNCQAISSISNDCPPQASLIWTNRPKPLHFQQVRAVWYRRPVPPVVDSEITDPGVRHFAIDECYEFLRGVWYSLDCYWMSHPDSIRRAEHKLVQLKDARHCEFILPKTIVTNSPSEVTSLNAQCRDGIIAKPLYLGFVKQGDSGAFIYTTRLTAEHLADNLAISLAPAIYQERIPKVADIRVTVVGEEVFAVKIVAPHLPDDIPDWRYLEYTELQHIPYSLPHNEQEKCRMLVRRLGLEFGAIDYALTEAGEHVFLEINPNGQWAWLETATGCPISIAIVNRLVAGAAGSTGSRMPSLPSSEIETSTPV